MQIIEAKHEDAEFIGKIHSKAWKQAYKEIFPTEYLEADTVEKRKKEFMDSWKDEDIKYFLLYDKKFIGMIKIKHCASFCEILSVYLLKDYWNKGFGTQAIQYIMNVYGLEELYLWTLSDNVNAQKFYEKNGFQKTGEKRIISRGRNFVQIKLKYVKV